MTGGWCTWHWELPTLPFFGACLEATVSLMRSNGGFAPRYDQRILQACPEQSAELVQRWEIAHFRANWSGNKQKLIRKWLVYFFSWGNWWFVMMMNQWILRVFHGFPQDVQIQLTQVLCWLRFLLNLRRYSGRKHRSHQHFQQAGDNHQVRLRCHVPISVHQVASTTPGWSTGIISMKPYETLWLMTSYDLWHILLQVGVVNVSSIVNCPWKSARFVPKGVRTAWMLKPDNAS